MSWIGLDWPQADEDLLRQAGQAWIDFGLALPEQAEPASAAAMRVWSLNEGDAATAFESWWTADEGPQHRLSDDAKAALLIGGALLAFAAITLTVKLSIIAQLMSLAVLVAQAVVTAFFTLGAGALEIGGFVAAVRVAVRKLLHELLSHVQTVIREILEKARALLRRGSSIRQLDLRLALQPRVFISPDLHVGQGATAIDKAFPGLVRGINQNVPQFNGLRREIDIDLGNLYIQVKSGGARGLAGQIQKTIQSTGVRTIGYAPDVMPNTAWETAAQRGVPIARSEAELIEIIRELR